MLRFCLNDFPEKLFRLVGIREMTFCWVDSVEIAFPKKLFRLVGPWGFVGIDSVENAFPKAISFKCISLVFAFGLLAIVYN